MDKYFVKSVGTLKLYYDISYFHRIHALFSDIPVICEHNTCFIGSRCNADRSESPHDINTPIGLSNCRGEKSGQMSPSDVLGMTLGFGRRRLG